MSAIHGRDDGDLKKYRTEIPNVVFTLGLRPPALALYCHLKRTTGAADGGLCYKSTRTLAKETCMSIGMVSEARAELEQPREELGGKPLIQVHRPEQKGKSVEVICVDVWAENFEHFKTRVHNTNTTVHNTNTNRSYSEHKKEPKKKEPSKNTPVGTANAVSAADFVALLDEQLTDATPRLTSARKARYGREFKEHLRKGTEPAVLDEAVDRIVERWEEYQLTVEQAIRDNGKPKLTAIDGQKEKTLGANTKEARQQRQEGYDWLFKTKAERGTDRASG